MKSILPIVIFLSVSGFAFAQSGTIKGTVKDGTSGEGVIGANVYILGSTQGAAVDINGEYVIAGVKAGTYTLIASFVSYRTDTIKSITVYPDQTTLVNVAMHEDAQELESVLVTARAFTNTDVSVITELKKGDLIAAGVSSQMIQMSQDRDAGQVIRRVPGVTIVGNRFVNVRGLSERYSTVMLNGVIAPSTEVDSKAFAFDLVPSNLIDRMLVYKSGSADLPGEFAGADINIYTKNVVEENSATLSLSGSFRENTTGESVSLAQDKSKNDWLGFGARDRALPAGFPSQNLGFLSQNPTSENITTLVSATRMLPNNWGTRGLTAAPDVRVGLDLSKSVQFGSKKLDNITSISYSHINQKLDVEQHYYDNEGPRYSYNDSRFSQVARLGAISNFTFEFNPRHRLEFRNFYNRQGDNQSTFRTGVENAQGFDVQGQSFNYYSRSIYSGQLSGMHSFSDAIRFDWILGYNNTTADQPDYRRIRSQRSLGSTDDFAIVIPPSASSFDAGRYYSSLNENTYTAVGKLEWKLNPGAEENRQSKIITGYYLEQKDRNFNARWMSYNWISPFVVDNSLLFLPYTDIFVPENLGTKFLLKEGTNEGPNNYDRYDGSNQLIAGHIGIATPIGESFRLSAGVRVEDNIQQIYVYDEFKNKSLITDQHITVPMPFFNLSYNFTEKMLVRVAYSRTVNRPVFRELAPFDYYDFDRNADVLGNPNLTTAKIDNVDLRWELYPSAGEAISFGGFYKYFQDPIEKYLDAGSNLIYNYLNADHAISYGVEAEVRKSLDGLTSSRFINNLTFVFNGALIKSEITIPSDPAYSFLQHKRAMQGQSPYVVNASLFYNNLERGLQFSIMYNVFGPRIFAVGNDLGNPNQYEMPRNEIDLTLTKQFGRHLQLKVGIQDLLNQQYRLIQDTNSDGKITSGDDPIQTFYWGRYVTTGLSWRL
jgi:outer membrane receptor protein involved in Fe transport